MLITIHLFASNCYGFSLLNMTQLLDSILVSMKIIGKPTRVTPPHAITQFQFSLELLKC